MLVVKDRYPGFEGRLDCGACGDRQKFVLRCPKAADRPSMLAKWREADPSMQADPCHPDACPRLRVEQDPDITRWLTMATSLKLGVIAPLDPATTANRDVQAVQSILSFDRRWSRE